MAIMLQGFLRVLCFVLVGSALAHEREDLCVLTEQASGNANPIGKLDFRRVALNYQKEVLMPEEWLGELTAFSRRVQSLFAFLCAGPACDDLNFMCQIEKIQKIVRGLSLYRYRPKQGVDDLRTDNDMGQLVITVLQKAMSKQIALCDQATRDYRTCWAAANEEVIKYAFSSWLSSYRAPDQHARICDLRKDTPCQKCEAAERRTQTRIVALLQQFRNENLARRGTTKLARQANKAGRMKKVDAHDTIEKIAFLVTLIEGIPCSACEQNMRKNSKLLVNLEDQSCFQELCEGLKALVHAKRCKNHYFNLAEQVKQLSCTQSNRHRYKAFLQILKEENSRRG